jgi:anti-sigma B factor antagonist
MNFVVEYPNEETAVLRLSGRFDTDSLGSIKSDLLAHEHLRYVIADMGQTSFIDSLGLAALVSILKVMRSRSGDFYVANPADVVRLLFELTRMDAAFYVVSDVDAALQQIQQVGPQVVIVKLPRRLDTSAVPHYRLSILGEISKRATRLVLDASQTQFIDSSGLALLVASYKAMAENGGKLALAALQENAREIFSLTRMDIIFLIYPTVQEATAALKQ